MFIRKGETEKQEQFCIEYIKDFNGTQAAIRAGYSKKTAVEQASRLLSNVNVRKRTDELLEERNKDIKAKVTVEYVLERLKRWTEINILDFYDYSQEKQVFILKDLTKLPRTLTDAISEITYSQKLQTTTIKIIDKRGCLVDLGRYLQMFSDGMVVQAETLEDLILKLEAEKAGKKGKEPKNEAIRSDIRHEKVGGNDNV